MSRSTSVLWPDFLSSSRSSSVSSSRSCLSCSARTFAVSGLRIACSVYSVEMALMAPDRNGPSLTAQFLDASYWRAFSPSLIVELVRPPIRVVHVCRAARLTGAETSGLPLRIRPLTRPLAGVRRPHMPR
ncbi:MAG: hypothetical protein JWR48_4579 [Mycobacterium sp.]|nr:hypothetical protein [Mycobacterium sp.]